MPPALPLLPSSRNDLPDWKIPALLLNLPTPVAQSGSSLSYDPKKAWYIGPSMGPIEISRYRGSEPD